MSSENASPARTETSLNISEIARDSSRSTRGAGLGEALGTAAAPLVNGCNVTLPVGMTKERRAAESAFTIIELLVVIAIIIVLAGLILSTVGYVQKKGARSRAEAEIAAISAALESYRADNGIYPRDSNTDSLFAVTDPAYASKSPPDPQPTSYDASASSYANASVSLYKLISGDTDADGKPDSGKTYFNFKPQMLGGVKDANGNFTSITYIRDPFGNSYGYSTSYQADVGASHSPIRGFNPTFDLWSTAGSSSAVDAAYEVKWIKNW